MANIFKLNPAAGLPRSEHREGSAGACEIILFPGVRYERWDVTPPPTPVAHRPVRKSRAKKRELELVD